MKAVLVSAFLSYEPRLFLVKAALEKLGVTTKVLITDFDHRKKARRGSFPRAATVIPTKPYTKNLSLGRILSHIDFSFKAKTIIEREAPEILYVLAPPNSLAYVGASYKKSHPNVKLIIDICDMWPEAFPSRFGTTLLRVPFYFWQNLRTSALKKADCVLTECNRFTRALSPIDAKTLFWSAKKTEASFEGNLKENELHLAYLGSINNILDIERTASLVGRLVAQKPVVVHVIGLGEKKEAFLSALREAGAVVVDHGVVFDQNEIGKIFSVCHAGLNILKPEVFVGLTMKSLEYFKFALPVINSLEGDTADFIKTYGVGFPLSEAPSLATLSVSEINAMKRKVQSFFNSYLETNVIMRQTVLIFKKIVWGGD